MRTWPNGNLTYARSTYQTDLSSNIQLQDAPSLPWPACLTYAVHRLACHVVGTCRYIKIKTSWSENLGNIRVPTYLGIV